MSTATGTAHRYERDSVEFARTFAFLDAVYAIALTLLVVNLDPPEAAAWQSLSTLLASGLGWQLLGFGISFAVIAVFWRANHRIVAGFNAITPATITANLVAIAFVVLVPFSTQGVSDAELADEPLTVTVYALNISIAVLAQSAVFFVARRDGVLRDPLPRAPTR
ncbi:TMEM175 family protein [Agromyces hippuratus]|uniref:TMEM175 family protein n=1 Tax=Agromyces hippuratus TaxID=286438 RepID=UPI0035ED4349